MIPGTSAKTRLEQLQTSISDFADDLDTISRGEKPASGRSICWAGDIATALRELLAEVK